jgi:cellulose synthase/poly-beta-1,6-N-acetylglucosamine synthase-like glycosyltransferase
MQALFPRVLEAIVAFLLLSGVSCLALMAKGAFVLRQLARENPREDGVSLLKSRLAPAVSVISAPEDAGAESRALVRRLVGLQFGNHEVVLVLNAPGDADFAAWRDEFHLEPSLRQVSGALPMGAVRAVLESSDPIRLTAIVLEPCSRGQTLNAAVNAAQCPVIALFGASGEFDSEALLRLIRPLLEDPQRTIAVCGVAPAATGAGLVAQFAALDFLRAWLGRQAALSGWNLLTPSPGSGVLVRRDSIFKLGGFRAGALDLVLRLHADARASKRAYRVVFVPGSGCFQRPPRSLAELRKEIARDGKGVARTVFMAGALPLWLRCGMFTIRFVRPLLETAAYVLTLAGLAAGWVRWPLALLVLLSTAGMGMLLSMAAVSLRELAEYRGSDPARLARLFFSAIPENLGFRQLRNLWLLVLWGKPADW